MNKSQLRQIIKEEIEDILSTTEEPTIPSPPLDEPEKKDHFDPVDMLFHGIEKNIPSEIDMALSNLDMPEEKERAIIRFVNFINADSMDLIRSSNKYKKDEQ